MEKIVSDRKRKYLSEIYVGRQPKELLEAVDLWRNFTPGTSRIAEPASGDGRQVFALVDEHAFKVSPQIQELAEILGRNRIEVRKVKTSEALKSMDTVLKICEWLLKKNADRTSLLLGIGGGILTDMAGFAASIYMRGIAYATVPTTLLAQVDAGIGGKTGVNFQHCKNMLGVICQPVFTFLCPAFLKTLARRDFFSGAAELLKTFMISNVDGAYGKTVLVLSCIAPATTQAAFHKAAEGFERELAQLIGEAVRVKMEIVTADPYEQGERRKLNLGHTFAHAIEQLAAQDAAAGKKLPGRDKTRSEEASLAGEASLAEGVTHGEAVAMGLVLAAGMSEKQGLAPAGFREQIESDLQSCGLGTECPFGKMELMAAMRHDKKSAGEQINFVLMRAVGDVVVVPVKFSGRK